MPPDPTQQPTPTPALPAQAEQLADRIVRVGMTVPEILFLETMRPLNNLGANTLHFLSPMMAPLMPGLGLEELAKFLELRPSVELLVCAIEQRETAFQQAREAAE